MEVQEFTSETPRLAGTETEHGCQAEREFNGHMLVGHEISPFVYNYRDEDIAHAGYHLETGDRAYPDINGHFEFATAEEISFRGVIEREFWGGQFVFRAMQRAKEAGRIADFKITKNVNNGIFYWGYHENYLTPRTENWQEQYVLPLAVHLATRQVFAGAGDLRPDGTYLVSQKADSTRSLNHGEAHQELWRPLVDMRDEPHADADIYRRQHITPVDPHLWKYPAWLQMATTSVVMRLVEGGVDLSDLYLQNPVAATHQVAKDVWLKQPLEMANTQKAYKALEIQYLLALRSKQFAETHPLPEEEQIAIKEWLRVLEDLQRNPVAFADRVEWIGKRDFLNAMRERRGVDMKHPHMVAAARNWTDLDPETGFGLRLQHKSADIPYGDDLEDGSVPPADTRAHARGRLIGAVMAWTRRSEDRPKHPIRGMGTDWSRATLDRSHSVKEGQHILMLDPYRSHYDHVEEVIDEMEAA